MTREDYIELTLWRVKSDIRHMTSAEEIRALIDKKIEEITLERVIKQAPKPIPNYPQPVYPTYPSAPLLTDRHTKCVKCGMVLDGYVMGYVCTTPDCPTFMNVSCSTSGA